MRSERRSHLFALAATLLVGLAPLVTPRVWAQAAGRRPAPFLKSRLGGDLRQLVSQLGPRPQAIPGVAAIREGLAPQQMQFDPQGRVGISITAQNPARLARALTALGMRISAVDNSHHVLEGFAPVNVLNAIEALAPQGLLGVTAIPPAFTDAGSVTSQATFVHESDRVNATVPPGVTGAGVRVGIISDSYNRLGGAPAGVTSGDLPAGVNVVTEGPASGTIDEGRAMAELIHDVAPGAALAFSTGAGGPATRAQSVRDLADPAKGNCDVIADDIFYMTEPFFQDGLTAQAIEDVVAAGTGYFCSAGNRARQAYQNTAPTFASTTIAGFTFDYLDFDPGPGQDFLQSVTVAANSSVTVALQWDDPFFTVSGVDSDVDLFVIDPAGPTLNTFSAGINPSSQLPYELVTISNITGAPKAYELAISRFSGPVPGRLKYVFHGAMTVNEFATNSPTINSNAAAVNAMAVGAVPYYDQDNSESFSSAGPSTILFTPSGTPLGSPEVRSKPDIAAIDGVDNTFFGTDAEGSGFPNFYGTSAAAPNAAAVAALVLEQLPSLTPAQLYSRMKTYADASVNGAGVDDLTGSGLINAYDAVFGFANAGTMPFSENMNSGALPLTFETHTTGAGRIQVTSANTPASGVGHVVLDSSVSGLAGRNEAILHVNLAGYAGVTLTFQEKEFTDSDDVMPGSFSGSSNSDGVALSVDGVTWYRISNLTGGNSTNTYNFHSINVSSAATSNGLTLGADTRIKFQQYGSAPAPSGGFAFDNIAITGSAGNQPPVVQGNKTVTVAEDAANTDLAITAPTDPDGNPLTIQVTSVPDTAKGDVRLDGGGAVVAINQFLSSAELTGLEFDPALNANGAAGTFAYTVSDGNGGSASQTVTINITPVNDPPVADADKTLTVLEDSGHTPLNIGFPTDVDSDSLNITVISVPDPAKGNVRVNVGGAIVTTGLISSSPLVVLQFEPAPNANGAAGTFAYTVTDGTGGSDTQTITINITPVNDAPVAQANKKVTVLEDAANTGLAITAPTDVDAEPLTITVTSVPNSAKGDVRLSGGGGVVTNMQVLTAAQLTGLEFDPALNANGAAGTFSYSVSDGNGGTASQTVTLCITPVNDIPVATGESYNTFRGTPLIVPAPGVLGNDTDVDGDTLTAVLVSNVSGGSLTLNPNGSFTYTPVIAFFGADTFTYRSSDGMATSNTVTVTINVSENPPASDANVAADGSGTINSSGGNGTLAFNVRRTTGVIMGSLTFTDPNRNRTVSSTQLTSLVMGPGRAMRIFGKGKLPTGAVVDFVADVNDVAEPGKSQDTFKLEISNGQTPQGTLTAGNIRVNR